MLPSNWRDPARSAVQFQQLVCMLQNCPQTLNLPLLTANSEELTASDLRKDCYKVQKLQTSLEEKGEKKTKQRKNKGKTLHLATWRMLSKCSVRQKKSLGKGEQYKTLFISSKFPGGDCVFTLLLFPHCRTCGFFLSSLKLNKISKM